MCTCIKEPTCAVELIFLWPPGALVVFNQTVRFTAQELTCDQLFFQSIFSTVRSLCVPKKRSACQNCDTKVSCSVSQSQRILFRRGVTSCVNVVTYSIVNESRLYTDNFICFIACFSFLSIDCCLPEVEVHSWIISRLWVLIKAVALWHMYVFYSSTASNQLF